VKIGFRYGVPTLQHHQISYRVNLALYRAFHESGIKIPFPQQEISISIPSLHGSKDPLVSRRTIGKGRTGETVIVFKI